MRRPYAAVCGRIEVTMSRLDQHVSLVKNKLAMGKFLEALAWTTLVGAGAACLVILIDRLFLLHLPRPGLFTLCGVAAAVLAAFAYALYRRPGDHEAAVAIDENL